MEYHISRLSINKFLNSYHRVGYKIKEIEFKSWLNLEREEIDQQEAFESTVIEISNPTIKRQKSNKKEFTYKKLKTTCAAKIMSLPNSRRNIWMLNMVMEILQ
jgi:hypothetical protein